jgi:hypothetical protein
MMDLRSSVAKESVTVVAQLASQYPEEFAESGHKYFRDLPNDGLIKLLNKAQKVVSSLAHECITQILTATCIPK